MIQIQDLKLHFDNNQEYITYLKDLGYTFLNKENIMELDTDLRYNIITANHLKNEIIFSKISKMIEIDKWYMYNIKDYYALLRPYGFKHHLQNESWSVSMDCLQTGECFDFFVQALDKNKNPEYFL